MQWLRRTLHNGVQIMATVTDQFTERQEKLAEINDLETRLAALRATLPTCYKTFFVFCTHPEKRVWIYADNQEQAVRKLHDRMNSNYGENWKIASKAVAQHTDPADA